jgi:hypothetical protein
MKLIKLLNENKSLKDLAAKLEIPENAHELVYTGSLIINSLGIESLYGCYKEIVEGNYNTGDFYCSTNKLTSLEFGPDRVDGDYDCSDNNLTNLKHCAEHIGGDFRCDNNKITSLEFMPKNIGLGKRNGKGDFYCQYNELTTLHDIHKRVKWINSTFNCHGNPIKECILGLLLIDGLDRVRCETDFNTSSAFNILQRHLPTRTGKSPRQAVIECQKELIEAGLEEFAKL